MSKTFDTKAIPFRLQAKAGSARTFTGMASTWDLDLGGDVIRRGAFANTLKEWRSSGRVIPLLDSHDGWSSVRSVVGKMTDAKETKTGLEATFELVDTPDGDEIRERLKKGMVTGLSIGYRPVKIEMPSPEEEQAGVFRFLSEVELREVSVVVFPMNPAAMVELGTVKGGVVPPNHPRRQLLERKLTERRVQAHLRRVRMLTGSSPNHPLA